MLTFDFTVQFQLTQAHGLFNTLTILSRQIDERILPAN
jgi:hypothetical protein